MGLTTTTSENSVAITSQVFHGSRFCLLGLVDGRVDSGDTDWHLGADGRDPVVAELVLLRVHFPLPADGPEDPGPVGLAAGSVRPSESHRCSTSGALAEGRGGLGARVGLWRLLRRCAALRVEPPCARGERGSQPDSDTSRPRGRPAR